MHYLTKSFQVFVVSFTILLKVFLALSNIFEMEYCLNLEILKSTGKVEYKVKKHFYLQKSCSFRCYRS